MIRRKEKVSRLAQTFAMRVKFERERRGFSQEKLAKFAGIGRSTLSQIEGLVCSPSLDIVEKMFRLRLTTLRNCIGKLFSDEDFDCLQSFLHGDLKLSKQETTAEIDRIKMSLLS